jgi:hypothetical protein
MLEDGQLRRELSGRLVAWIWGLPVSCAFLPAIAASLGTVGWRR